MGADRPRFRARGLAIEHGREITVDEIRARCSLPLTQRPRLARAMIRAVLDARPVLRARPRDPGLRHTQLHLSLRR